MALRPKSLLRSLVRMSRPVRLWNPSFVWLRVSGFPPLFCIGLLVLGVACSLPSPAIGQADVNDVHVMPREVTPRETDKTKTEEVANGSVIPASLNTHIRP